MALKPLALRRFREAMRAISVYAPCLPAVVDELYSTAAADLTMRECVYRLVAESTSVFTGSRTLQRGLVKLRGEHREVGLGVLWNIGAAS